MSFKKCNVVMLTTKEKADIFLGSKLYNHIGRYNENLGKDGSVIAQHLYITSDEEIKVGDWIFDNYAKIDLIQQVRVCDLESSHNRNGNWHKIIATTDEQLRIDSTIRSTKDDDYGKVKFIIPLIYKQFIEKYIEEYNKCNIITEVFVEYDVLVRTDAPFNRQRSLNENTKVELKINPDNTINIKLIKDSWTREEVIRLCTKALQDGNMIHEDMIDNNDINKWLKENL